jgi:hypothetical protein
VGASAAVAAAVGPLLGGFVTTFMSWRVGFLLEVVVIAIVLSGIRLIRDVPYTGDRAIDLVGALLSLVGMGGIVLGILVWQEGGDTVAAFIVTGAVSMVLLGLWLVRRKKAGKTPLLDPDLLRSTIFRLGISGQMLQQIALGGAMIVLPIFLQMVLEYNAMQAGLSLAPLSLTMFFVAMWAGRKLLDARPARVIRIGFAVLSLGVVLMLPLVPRIESALVLALPLAIAGVGFGLLVSQLNNYTLAPIDEERISEAAGVNSAAGSFGLSFGLAFAGGIMLAVLSYELVRLTEESTLIPPEDQARIATALEEDAQIVTDTQLQALLVEQPQEVAAEVVRINDEARARALQAALLVPLAAALIGFVNSFRMMRQPDVRPSASLEGAHLMG